MTEAIIIGLCFILFLLVIVVVNYIFTKNNFGGGFYIDDFSNRTKK